MAKYDEQFKLRVVRQYLSGLAGARAVGAEHCLDHATVRRWASSYRQHGVSGPRRKGASYDAAFKLKVLRRMEHKCWSQLQAAAAFDIRCPAHIGKLARQYDAGGIDALQPLRKGRPKVMSNKPPKKPDVLISKLDDKQIIARQNQELIELRAEVAYLRKLDALIQEKRATAQKKRKP